MEDGLSGDRPICLLNLTMDHSPAQFQRLAPTLETERLVLRAFRRDDLDAHAATLSDSEVMRHLGGEPTSRENAWRKLMMAVGQWPLLGYGYWAVETKADGRLVGQAGLCDFERGLTPDIGGLPEMGWIFDRSVHGQGIAGEACRAVLDWAESALVPSPIWSIISPDNLPSIKLAERLGFERTAVCDYHGEPIVIFQRPVRV
jgi:RimJ/RimL family protein N-acetyltransferase